MASRERRFKDFGIAKRFTQKSCDVTYHVNYVSYYKAYSVTSINRVNISLRNVSCFRKLRKNAINELIIQLENFLALKKFI